MNAKFYVNNAINYGNKKVKSLYKEVNRPLAQVEMRLITRLVGVTEALEHEYAEYMGCNREYWNLYRDYNKVCRVLVKTCKAVNRYRRAMENADFHEFDQYL